MITTIDYALMAGHAYRTTRDEINWIPVPQGWTPFFPVPDPTTAAVFPVNSGFEAIAFQRGTEIVISYSGTDPNNWNLFTTPDGKTNAALYAGKWADQLMQAAEYYLQIKATNPLATKITLTGHSLGGGLAALVGVFFDVRATTFDQAPFAASARFESSDGNWRSNAEDLLAKLSAKYAPERLTGLTEYVRLLNLNIFSNVTPRMDRVDTIRVDKEILQNGLGGAKPFGNPDVTLKHGSATGSVAGDDLHSQALLSAFLQSGDTPTSTASDHTLGQVSFKLTDLLKMLFDKNLFATDAATREKNFLDHLVRHEAGVRDPATGAISIAADAMLTRFTTDLWKIAQEGGMTMADKNLADALIAFAMQMYYENKAAAADNKKTLFTATGVTGGLRFDRADVAATLDAMKGYNLDLKTFIATLPAAEQQAIAENLPRLTDWFIQAGTALMTATATDKAAFMLGGAGGDTLDGGADADLYIINTGDGEIHGKDSGRNRIRYNGELLTGAFVQDVAGGAYRFAGDKNRRWRHGERGWRAANDNEWRRLA